MKKLLLLILLLPAAVMADPSVSSDASQSIDNSSSDTFKRDKSLTTDKGDGRKHTDSDSKEKAKEGSTSQSHSSKISTNADNSQSGSTDLNINSILLREFINRYEKTDPDPRLSKSQNIFASCKPLTGIISEYPILNSCPVAGMGTDVSQVVPLRLATHFAVGSCGAWGGANDGGGGTQLKLDFDPSLKVVSQYARCRIIASEWISEAAKRAETTGLRDENQVHQRIQVVFAEMDKDQFLFNSVVKRSAELWDNANCTPNLERYNDFKEPDMACGIFSVKGNSITVNGQETLSANSIAGRSFKIAISSSDAESVAVDDSKSVDRRESVAVRSSNSNETYDEDSRKASLSKSKSTDLSNSAKTDQSAGNNLSATPKD
jgi:hypothetical protein